MTSTSMRYLAAAVATVALSSTAVSAQTEATYRLDLPAQDMEGALNAFAAATQQQVVFRSEVVRGKRSNALHGRYTAEAALDALIRNSGLTVSRGKSGIFVIAAAPTVQPAASNGPSTEADQPPPPVIIVTGTHISGAPLASPVVQISERQVREAGMRDLGEVARSIPSNYSGGQNPGSRFQTGDAANTNVSGGSSFNLRGLGPDATLTLLNGQRLSYNANSQAVDISTIPLDAVSAIEVIPDGSSAIYGSDAVAGVANIILKPDYDGVSLNASLGLATRGGGFQQAYEGVTGGRWGSGGVLIAGQYERQNAVRSGQRDFTKYVIEPNTLLDAENHYGGLVSLHQDLGASLEFSVDALYNRRHSEGAEYSDDYYIAPIEFTNESYAIAPKIRWAIGGSWQATLSGFIGSDNTWRLDDFIERDTGDSYGSEGTYDNTSRGAEMGLSGDLIQLPGGAAKVAVGFGYRYNHYESRLFGVPEATIEGGRNNYYGFGELSLPFVSSANASPGLQQLALSAALRHEEYDQFGGVTTPKLGLLYAPVDGMNFKLSWGRSFKAPTLAQQYSHVNVYLSPASQLGGDDFPATATVLRSSGGNPDLGPERARTISATFEIDPALVSGLHAAVTWFDIDYRDRVVQPLLPTFAALSDPALAEFIQYDPSAAEQAALIARDLDGLRSTVGPYVPENVVAIANGTLINAARQKLKGVDLSGSYDFALGRADMRIMGSASWLTSAQRNSAGAEEIRRAGTNFSPPKFRARGGVRGELDAITTTVYVNYLGPLTDTAQTPPRRGSSMTTVDATLIWRMPATTGLLEGTQLSLSAQNLLDARPPYYEPYDDSSVNYDSTNYSPLGRFLRLSLRKTW